MNGGKRNTMKKIMSILAVLVVGSLVLSGIVVTAVTDIKSTTVTNNLATMDNQPPYAPKITGPELVSPGIHEYAFKAIDPDGDDVFYQIDWGDHTNEDWFGPFKSGGEVTRNHTYYKYGTVAIMARAKDIHGAIGDWGTFNVEIPKSKQMTNPIFFRFVERFIERFLMIK